MKRLAWQGKGLIRPSLPDFKRYAARKNYIQSAQRINYSKSSVYFGVAQAFDNRVMY